MKVPKLFIEDLSSGQIAVIEKRMRPSQYSKAGFLGQNQSLREVIEADTQVLEQYGITHKQVGDRLDSLMGQAFRQWDLALRAGENYFRAKRKGALIDDFLRVSGLCSMGRQECPFFYEAYNCPFGSWDFTVKNERQGTDIEFPELMAHLIRDHHFFEGNTLYRLNPEDAIKVLGLKPGVDYSPKTETEILWKTGSSTSDITDENFCDKQKIIRNADREINIAPGAKLYLSGDEGLIIAREEVQLAEPLMVDGVEILLCNNFIGRGQQKINRIEHKYVVG